MKSIAGFRAAQRLQALKAQQLHLQPEFFSDVILGRGRRPPDFFLWEFLKE
jgi:hypothetical protein